MRRGVRTPCLCEVKVAMPMDAPLTTQPKQYGDTVDDDILLVLDKDAVTARHTLTPSSIQIVL